jgi:23S rRNA (uridine2552-2'-O)-methyltransferase
MPSRWYTEKKQEYYYRISKQKGYRARSAFKLLQIQKKYHVLKKGDTVIDLGAAPGGWSQVTKEIIGNGKVIAVDKEKFDPLPGILFIKGDITKRTTIDKIRQEMQNGIDVVLSDLSPNISGNYSMDHAKSVWLCLYALDIAQHVLKKNGCFICKIFEGESLQEFIDEVTKRFTQIKIFSPKATRKHSSETYVIVKGFKGFLEPLIL